MNLREKIIEWHKGKRKRALADFAQALGIQSQRISHWLSGRNWPDEDIQPQVCKMLGITAAELQTMRPAPKPIGASIVADHPYSLADVIAKLDGIARDVSELHKRVATLERSRGPLRKPAHR